MSFEVLSDVPLDDYSLRDIMDECDDGDFVMGQTWVNSQQLTGKEMARALYQVGSEPEFFSLDDEGNSLE